MKCSCGAEIPSLQALDEHLEVCTEKDAVFSPSFKYYAVGYINWFDHDLKIEIIKAVDVRDAISKHSSLSNIVLLGMPQELEDIKQWFFDQDAMIEVIELCHHMDESDYVPFCDGCDEFQRLVFGKCRTDDNE